MAAKTKNRNTKKRKWIVPVAVVAAGAVAAVLVVPNLLNKNAMAAQPAMNTTTVERGTIETTVVGSGTLSANGTLSVDIPSSVTVETVLVEAGDTVAEGDALATVDLASVSTVIADVQSEVTSLDAQIESAKEDEGEATIESAVSGRVKQVYAQEGDNVQDVMAGEGALCLLSLDGYMKVSFEASADIGVGSDVTVVLADGSEETGSVTAYSGGVCTVTVTDDGPALNESVTVQDEDGNTLGGGTLEINVPISISAAAGTIESVDVEENDSVSDGDTLFTLADGSAGKEYQSLLLERMEYEAVLQTLIELLQTGTLTAPTAGTVSEVSISGSGASADSALEDNMAAQGGTDGQMPVSSESSGGVEVTLLSSGSAQAHTSGLRTVLLQSVDDGASVTEISGTLEAGITAPVAGQIPQKDVTLAEGQQGYTGTITWEPASEAFEPGTVYTATVTLTADAGHRFADTLAVTVPGATIEGLVVSPAQEGNTVTFKAVFAATQAAGQPQQQTGGEQPSPGGATQQSGSGISISGMSSGGSSSAGGSSAAQDAASADTTDSATALTQLAVTLQTGGATLLSVNIDELDILTMEVGQEATVVLDALPDQEFTAEVVKISASGNAQTGVTTYPVTMQLMGTEGAGVMEGMNATATIVTDVSEDVLLIPMDALIEMGGSQFVLIAGAETDEEGEEVASGEQREVETGLSDGLNVEITSGLSEGERVMWQSTSDDSEDSMAGFAMSAMGGGMSMGMEPPSGDFQPPSGGSGGPPSMGG